MIKHIAHVDDMAYDGKGILAIDAMHTLKDILLGKKHKHSKLAIKYDGAPAIVFGKHPENGRFFVGTKSVFNKRTPIFCYNTGDIQKHYGDKPELAEKMWYAFMSIYSLWDDDLIPTEGVYQGDFLYYPESIVDVGSMVCITPNTITYGAVKDTPEYKKILSTYAGIALHTSYVGDTMLEMKPYGKLDMNEWVDNDFVYWVDTTLNTDDIGLTECQAAVVDSCLERAEFLMGHLELSVVQSHEKMLKQFTNHCIRIGEIQPSQKMYKHFLKCKGETELLETVDHSTINSVIGMRYALDYTKRILMNCMNNALPFYHECDGDTTAGEGYVMTYHGNILKLVDRMEFSRRNFHNMRFVCQK